MRLGICTRYCHNEGTYAAIRIGNWAVQRGHNVSAWSITPRPPAIDHYWDKQAAHSKRWRKTTDWVEQYELEAVLFTFVPHPMVLRWLSDKNVPGYVLVAWHELARSDREALEQAAAVLIPHRAGFDYLRSWGLRNLVVLPWDTGEPYYTKPYDYEIEYPKILLPIYDGVINRMEFTVLDLVGRALVAAPALEVTIAYSSSTMRSAGHRRLQRLKQQFPQRVHLKSGQSLIQRAVLYGQHDLTIWPTEFESTCMVGLSSLSHGTPLLTCGVPPVTEVCNNTNSIIIQGELFFDNILGLPRLLPDFMLMDEVLQQLVVSPHILRDLQKGTAAGLVERRRGFEKGLAALIH